jgi:phosphatidylglycerol---prolipoprotein diacylglyceryl transferase
MNYLVHPQWLRPEIIPGLPFRWYGLMYIIVIAVTYLLFRYQVKQQKLALPKNLVEDMLMWCIIGALLGARIFAVTLFSHDDFYLTHPWRIFWPFDENWRFVGLAGMNYYGGVIGGLLAFIIFGKIRKINMLQWGDMLMTAFPLGYTFGRLGNFINGELYGRITSQSWGMLFPHAEKVPTASHWVQRTADAVNISTVAADYVNLPRYPTQIIEGFFEGIVLWLVLWFIFRPRKSFHGYMLCLYIIGYGAVRFWIDFLRVPLSGKYTIILNDSVPPFVLATPWNFTMSQVFDVIMVIGGIAGFILLRQRAKAKAAAPPPSG